MGLGVAVGVATVAFTLDRGMATAVEEGAAAERIAMKRKMIVLRTMIRV